MKISRKRIVIIVIVLALIALAVLLILRGNNRQEEEKEDVDPRVTAIPYARLLTETSIVKTGIIQPAKSAPLVARLGGRVTGLPNKLGDIVRAGNVIVKIDTGVEGNPTQAQASGSAEALKIFNDLQAVATEASKNAVTIANLNLEAAKKSRPLTNDQAKKAQELAANSAEETRLALGDARDLGQDNLIRTADLADKAAKLAAAQAIAGTSLTNLQTATSLKQAQVSFANAELAHTRTIAELATQKSQLTTALRVSKEQLKLQQVTAPVNGHITSLKVKVGDIVSPGQVVGEVNALEGAQITIDVTTATQSSLSIGQTVAITSDGQEFSGEISHLASAPASTTGLWQVDIFVTSTPKIISAGDSVSVLLPASANSQATFIPLDAVVVRQSGVIVFTVDETNRIVENVLQVDGFEGKFVEARANLAADDLIVVSGSRTLQQGDKVVVNN